MEQSLAGLISDRATDEVVEALTRYRRGLGISDSPSMHFDDHQTPDVVRSRSSQVSEILSKCFDFKKNKLIELDDKLPNCFYRTQWDLLHLET